MDKSPEELYQEREKRIADAFALKVPDRVPVLIQAGFFPARYTGITFEEYMYDAEKITSSALKVLDDFQFDAAESPFGTRFLGAVLEALDYRQLRWPGHGVNPNLSYQYVEGEYMKAEEYDTFLDDPSDFMIRAYWPRIAGAFEPFGKVITSFHDMLSYLMGIPFGMAPFGTEEMQKTFDAMYRAGVASQKLAANAVAFVKKVASRGWPMQTGGYTQAPFDTLGDFLRGTRGIMMDMYRCPEKLLAALDKITPWMIRMGASAGKRSGNPRIFIPLHKGSDAFMSEKQFKTFYWPTLKQLMLGLIDEGMNPLLLVEADHTSRLEIMADVPPGKICYHMENTDIFKAKEVLGDRVCLRGNVPIAMLCTGSPDDIKAYCKKLIDVVGKDGGFIMDSSVNVEDAKIENIRAMIDFTKEYGVYR